MFIQRKRFLLVLLTAGAMVSSPLVLSGCADREVLTGSDSAGKKHIERNVQADLVGKTADIWFVKPGGESVELVKVQRKSIGVDKLASAVEDLLRGPTPEEEAQGIASEIPKGTILLGVRPLDDDFEIDLSKRFSSGGGGASMEARIEQLKRTVSAVVGERKVYLNIEGKRLFAAAGEGLEVTQPIN